MDRPETLAGAVEGALGALDRLGQRALEGDEAAVGAAVGGKLEQRLLGRLDLLRAVQFRRRRRRRC